MTHFARSSLCQISTDSNENTANSKFTESDHHWESQFGTNQNLNTKTIFQTFISALELDDPESREAEIALLVDQLPEPNKCMLKMKNMG